MDDTNGHGGDGDLTAAVDGARRGFRRDVQALLDALPDGELLVPLSSAIEGADEDGIELSEGLEMQPHLLVDPEGKLWCVLFTEDAMLERVAERVEWTTDGGPLEFVAVPALVGLDMALRVIDEETVLGLIINALDDSELLLRRQELASLCGGVAVPLVGYVQNIPEQDFEHTLVAEEGDPPPAELITALDGCVREIADLDGYVVKRTFNPDRDLEPHLTLELHADEKVDQRILAERVFAAVESALPPPGYVDIVFAGRPN